MPVAYCGKRLRRLEINDDVPSLSTLQLEVIDETTRHYESRKGLIHTPS